MIAPTILSLVFFAAFAFYSLFGVYILLADRKAFVNRIFFVLCLSLCVWSFGFSITYTTTDLSTAVFWHRVSALGWGSIYAFLLHFVIHLTQSSHLLRHKWQVALLYLPSVLVVSAFSIISSLAEPLNNLILTEFGWSYVFGTSLWDWLFNAYYAIYSLAVVVLVIRWRRKVERSLKKALSLCLIAFLAAFVLGTITDLVLPYFLNISAPQISSIFILLPIAGLYNCARKNHFMKPNLVENSDHHSKKKSYVGHIILQNAAFKDESELSFYTNKLTSLFYFPILMFTSIINLSFFSFFPYQSFGATLVDSLVLLGLGHAFYMASHLFVKETVKAHTFNVLVIFLLVYMLFRFYNHIGPAVWTASFIFIMLAMSRNDRKMLTALSLTLLLMGIYVTVFNVPFVVDLVYYLSQFFFFAIMLAIASVIYFINARRRIRIAEQLSQMVLISHISKSFVAVSHGNIDEKIQDLLHLSGEHLQADRSYLYQLSYNSTGLKYTHEWCHEGIASGIAQAPDIDCLELSESQDWFFVKNDHILLVPVTSNDKVLGCIGFEKTQVNFVLHEDHRDMLSVLANTLGDALAKVSAETEINRMAFYDELTDLPNRACFVEKLSGEIKLAQDNNFMIGLLFIDLDSFKAVNDSLGHDGGDELLQRVARRLTESVRAHDMVARFGGDEYLIMLTNVKHAEDVCRIADKLMRELGKSLTIKSQDFFVTASTGIAIYPIDGSDPATLIKSADLAMYASKNQGKNKYTLCSPILKEETNVKSRLTTCLYKALENNELMLHYQPQINVVTKQIIGLEALLRWNHPQMGMVSPATFIPLAEQTGLINPIGEWVLMTACHQNLAWQIMGIPPIRMAVNLSVIQFQNPKLVDIVRQVLRETGLSAEYLELEITESVAVNSSDHIIQVLNELKLLGTTISIDDFGVEYSSLNRLKLLPVDRIKMDMQFVHSISKSLKDDAIARIIIQLARNLDLKVIAEGVETETQLNFLTNQVCDEVQGYYYYKPMPAAEIETILLAQNDMLATGRLEKLFNI